MQSPDEQDPGSSLKKRKKSNEVKIFGSSGSERDGESASENISLSQMKKKSRRIKSLDQTNTPTGALNNLHPSDSEGAGSNPASVGRRRHTSSGQSQVRSLYDGLSHLYTDCDSR